MPCQSTQANNLNLQFCHLPAACSCKCVYISVGQNDSLIQSELWWWLPCNSATCHNWPRFYGIGNFLWYTWSLLRNLTTWLSSVLATLPHAFTILCWPTTDCTVTASHCTRSEIPIHYRNYLLFTQPPHSFHKYGQYTGIFWWQMIAVFDRVRYLPPNSTTCLCTLNCTVAKVKVQVSIRIA
jgi:hypothetical protein